MSLRETQALFWRAITWPTGVEDFLAQADAETRQRFERTFGETDRFARVERLDVYAQAYFWRLHDVLRDGFPTLAFALGEARFRNLVTDYLLARPSTDPALRHLGDALVDFSSQHAEARERPWAVDAARLDHWRYRLLDVPDEPVLDPSSLSAISIDRWPGLRFRMSSAAHLLRAAWDVHALWERARADGGQATAPEAGDFFVLVWRRDFAVVHRSLDPAQGRALESLSRGESFTEISAHAESGPDGQPDPQQVVGWLSAWLSAGVIAAVIAEDD